MVEEIYSVLLVGTGIVGLFFCIKALLDPAFARKHVETSPKVWLWRKYFGTEKALIMTQKIFLPLGIVISVGLIIFGIVVIV
ncbi:MAG: hypothetical protein PVF58_07960 [Candidatus Methanofastidiosia archaeon]|jgi:hypothetical protein